MRWRRGGLTRSCIWRHQNPFPSDASRATVADRPDAFEWGNQDSNYISHWNCSVCFDCILKVSYIWPSWTPTEELSFIATRRTGCCCGFKNNWTTSGWNPRFQFWEQSDAIFFSENSDSYSQMKSTIDVECHCQIENRRQLNTTRALTNPITNQ